MLTAGIRPWAEQIRRWCNRAMPLGTVAREHLLTVACTPPSGASHHHDWLGLSNVLSVLLGKHPSIQRELMARAADDRGFAAYPVIARLLPSTADLKAARAL